MLSDCSKDEILDHYNNIVQSAGAIELTGKSSLEGTKEKGIDDYTGTYTADYEDFSDTEYLFGGTSIKREAGKELSIDCTLEVTEGTANGWHPAADCRGDFRHTPSMALYRPSLGGCVWMPDGNSELSGFQKRRRLKHTAS